VLAEIVTIGDELCRGEIIDTNSSWLAAALWDLDITVAWMTSCRDAPGDIRRALGDAVGRAEVVLVSGGLGPTVDDLTVDVVAALVGVEPEVHEPSLEKMKARFAKAAFRLTPNNLRQVRAPAGAHVTLNPAGLAPGFEVALAGTPVICLPGVPRELYALYEAGVRPRLVALREAAGERAERLAKRTYRVFGMGESHVATAIENALDGVAGASLHFQVKFPETLVKVVVRAATQAGADAGLAAIEPRIRGALGPACYGTDDDSLAAVLGAALVDRGARLAVAESCTGGMVGALITEVPGSSVYFAGGAITYSDDEKQRQLGVRADTLATHGAVSAEVVREMAAGARDRFGVDYAVALSGVAGPGGGTEDKPVGLVWLAAVGPGGAAAERSFTWPAARDQVRGIAAYAALALVLRLVRGEDARR
jgi:nicotinamide-nucleotide amidase